LIVFIAPPTSASALSPSSNVTKHQVG